MDLAGDRITPPELARLADTIEPAGTSPPAAAAWVAGQPRFGLYDRQQDRRSGKETDLARVSRVRGGRFDLAFLQVMTARHRAGTRLAAAEMREGGVPEVRELVREMVGLAVAILVGQLTGDALSQGVEMTYQLGQGAGGAHGRALGAGGF